MRLPRARTDLRHAARALALALLGGAAGCASCDPAGLERITPSLDLSPASATVVVWIGFPAHVALAATNTSRVPVDIGAPALAGVPDGLSVDVDAPEGLEGGAGAAVDVALAADRPLAADVMLTLPPGARDVAPASAVLHVEARTPPPCAPRGPCEDARFDADAGACVRDAHPDGSACDDGSACTDDDRCSAGACVGAAVACADGVGCTVDACDPARGCVFTPVDDLCADDDPCTANRCVASTGCAHATAPDGTPCGAFSCATFSVCVSGGCFTEPTPDGFPCEDGDLCTSGDTCEGHACVAGDPVEPAASAPAALARPSIHVEPDPRWFRDGRAELPPAFDVALDFGAVLDVEQALAGVTPVLAVLWKSAPFSYGGAPCAPWDMWQNGVVDDAPPFCATAVVVTFVGEDELAAGEAGGGGVASPVDVVYGTVDGTFRDADHVVVAESTYTPGPASARLVRVLRASLAWDTRSLSLDGVEQDDSGPRASVAFNVHAGLRVAADADDVSLLGWDLPYVDDSAPPAVPGGSAGTAAVPVSPSWTATLDAGARLPPPAPAERGVVTWDPLLTDACDQTWPPAAEEVSFSDVDVARAGGHTFAVVRHGLLDPDTDGCTPGTSLSLVDVDAGTVTPWGGVIRAASLTRDAGVLAVVDEALTACDALWCSPYELAVQPAPFDQADPVVTLVTFPLQDDGAVPVRVAALAGPPAGAVVESADRSGGMTLHLVDAMDTAAPLSLTTGTLPASSAPLRALRSPLSPQSVYAVTTAGADGLVVRFGCPFPSAPAPP